MRKPLAGLGQEASTCVSAATALIAAEKQAALDDEVPPRVGLLPFTLGPLAGHGISVREFAAHATPDNPKCHA